MKVEATTKMILTKFPRTLVLSGLAPCESSTGINDCKLYRAA